MTTPDRILTIHIDRIPPEGTSLEGDVTPAQLRLDDLPRATFAEPVLFAFKLSLVKGRLLVRGSARTTYRARCDRCLTEYEHTVAAEDICHYFDDLDNEEIDLTEPLREDILIDFPQRLLCADACRGLCPSCGVDLNKGTCDCTTQASGNGPWSALDGFNAGGA